MHVIAVSLFVMALPGPSGARGVVVSHPLNMREALGSIPRVSRPASLAGFYCPQGGLMRASDHVKV